VGAFCLIFQLSLDFF